MTRALAIVVVLVGCSDRPEAAPVAKPTLRVGSLEDDLAGEPGPHRLYPVAGPLVGNEVEDRGPPVPKRFAMPSRRSLTWTRHAYCEPGPDRPFCGPDHPAAIASFRVGRGTRTTVVEELLGTRVRSTWVYLDETEQTPAQRVTLDRSGRPTNLVLLRYGRYTSRNRDGGNGLKGCGSHAVTLDANQRIVEQRCLRRNGEPMRDLHGVAVRRKKRDPWGLVVEDLRFDSDGKPITASDHGHRLIWELDAVGRDLTSRVHGLDDTIVMSSDGCFGRRVERDQRGQVVRNRCLGPDERPMADSRGIAQYVTSFDRRGCTVSDRYFGPGGEPTLDEDGVHGVDLVPDASCLARQHTCVGLSGERVRCGPTEPARYVFKRDRHDRVVSTKHYAPDGAPTGDAEYRAFEIRTRWDDDDHLIAASCHDPDGEPMECGRTGFHLKRTTYDAAGRAVTQHYFDEAGAPTHNHGSIGHHYRYDEYDRIVETTNLETDGTSVDFTGMKTKRNVYDAYHRLSAILLFDRDGRPARYRSCFTGATCPKPPWHAVRIERRSDGRVERNVFFDHAAQLIKTVHCTNVPCFE